MILSYVKTGKARETRLKVAKNGTIEYYKRCTQTANPLEYEGRRGLVLSPSDAARLPFVEYVTAGRDTYFCTFGRVGGFSIGVQTADACCSVASGAKSIKSVVPMFRAWVIDDGINY